jgi:hypothetical protein
MREGARLAVTRTDAVDERSVGVLSRRRFLGASLATGALVALGAETLGRAATTQELGSVRLASATTAAAKKTTTVKTTETAVPLGRSSVFTGNPHGLKSNETISVVATANEPFTLALIEVVSGKPSSPVSHAAAKHTAGVYRASLSLTKSSKHVAVRVTNGAAAMRTLSVTSTVKS